jgi:C4-dicarboxylate transporter DctM subunit
MRQLSMAGVVPGLVLALFLVGVCIWYGRKSGCDNGEGKLSLSEIGRATQAAGPALLMPLIIVGGIWSGFFTPTESAAVAVVYGVVVSLVLYRDITVRDLPRLLVNAFQTSATVMLVIGATGALAWLITAEQVAVQLAGWIKIVASEPWMFLLLVNVVLLLLGIFIEPLPALLLTAPLFLPLAQTFGIDLVHLGVVMTANLAIALYTPPVGGTLFVAAKLAKAGIGEITRALWPLLAAAVAALIVITYVPSMTRVVWQLLS